MLFAFITQSGWVSTVLQGKVFGDVQVAKASPAQGRKGENDWRLLKSLIF